MTDTGPDEVSEETMMVVAHVRHKAGQPPTVTQITGLALDAVGRGGGPGDLSADEIRQLAATALHQARRVSFLLGKLAGLTGDEHSGGDGGGQL